MPSLKYKLLLVTASAVLFVILTSTLISTFGKISPQTVLYSFECPLCIILFSYSFPILLAWLALLPWCSFLFVLLSSVLCLLTVVKTEQNVFLLYIVYYVLLFFFLTWEHQRKKNILVINALDVEKTAKEKNILETSLAEKSKALEIYLHTYVDYSNLRKVIDDFSSTLALDSVCELIVNNAFNMIGKGELVLLYLVDLDKNSLSLYASKSIDNKRRTKIKKGDIFDQWVLKNRQQLLVSDITKDVRFDKHLSNIGEEFKSLVVTPLIYELRVVGTLRINSEAADTFYTDDLRALSVVGSIASAALSNAFLYQKTEELAIKDSLTGLFVHRYFKERLSEEHKRALLTNTSLTLLMADLDNFKSYNDRYGHAAGDIILKKVSTIFVEKIKESGFVARYGGEEFAVLLPKTSKEAGVTLAQEIRKDVANEKFDLRGVSTKITISIGVANMPDDTLDREELIKLSDTCLYEAKKKGRNKVIG